MTRQVTETIYYKKNEYEMKDTPLDAYLREKEIRFHHSSSACWRGYVGKWEIKDEKLYLIDFLSHIIHKKPISEQEKIDRFLKDKDYYKKYYGITDANQIGNFTVTKEEIGLDYLFPGQKEVFADWFTGEIIIPHGKVLYYSMRYSIYEKYLFLQFKNGVLISEETDDKGEMIIDYSDTSQNTDKNLIIIELTKDILDTFSVNEIIYAEIAEAEAMGCAGQAMLYIIKNEELICYKTNLFKDENTYMQVQEILFKYGKFKFPRFGDLDKQTKQTNSKNKLIYYEGGVGNSVFVNKNVSLKVIDNHFVYEKNNKEYRIFSSVLGVFKRVVYDVTRK